MGNWSGTVRCGHCYGEGHNKRTCPTRLEQIQTRYKQEKESTGEGHATYYARQIASMTGVNPETGQKTTRRREYYGRKCSYCTEQGHNRATCPALRNDKAKFSKLTREVRQSFLTKMQEHGLGPGALVAVKGSYGDSDQPYLVTGIGWWNVTRKTYDGSGWLGGSILHARRIQDNRLTTLNLPVEVTGADESRYGQTTTMLGGVASVEAPTGWLEGKTVDLESVGLFDKGVRRDYRFWRDLESAEENNNDS